LLLLVLLQLGYELGVATCCHCGQDRPCCDCLLLHLELDLLLHVELMVGGLQAARKHRALTVLPCHHT
jgi:hypothetical protein